MFSVIKLACGDKLANSFTPMEPFPPNPALALLYVVPFCRSWCARARQQGLYNQVAETRLRRRWLYERIAIIQVVWGVNKEKVAECIKWLSAFGDRSTTEGGVSALKGILHKGRGRGSESTRSRISHFQNGSLTFFILLRTIGCLDTQCA